MSVPYRGEEGREGPLPRHSWTFSEETECIRTSLHCPVRSFDIKSDAATYPTLLVEVEVTYYTVSASFVIPVHWRLGWCSRYYSYTLKNQLVLCRKL